MGATAAETDGRSQDTEALYREHGAAVARLCRSLLRDRAEAEDAAQQVFLSAHRALLNGATPREPLAWLLAVARHECYARFRERAAAPVPAEEEPEGAAADASVQALRAGELAHVWDEVGRMPPAQREAFLLREIRGLSYGQLAEELSLSRPSVRSLLLRARTRLRQRLGDAAAGLGGVQWVQALRLLAGGDGPSPAPAATKAAAVGVSALALAGGGSLVARHASSSPTGAGARHRDHARVQMRHAAAPAAIALPGVGSGLTHHSSEPEGPRRRDDASRESGSDRSGPRDGSGDRGTSSRSDSSGGDSSGGDSSGGDSSGDGSSGSGRDGSGDTTAVAQPTTDGHDGGGTSSSSSSDGGSSGPGPGSTDAVSTSGSGRDGGGSGSGSDGGSDSSTTTTTTTMTTSGSDGSGGGHDGGSSGGHDG